MRKGSASMCCIRVPLHIYVRFLLTKPPEKQRNVVKMRRNLKIMCRSFLVWPHLDLGTGNRTAGSGGKGKWVGRASAMDSNVVSLQINTAGIIAMNRVDRIVLDPIRTRACTRTARTGVRVTVPLSL